MDSQILEDMMYQDWMTEEEYVNFSIDLFNKFEVVKQTEYYITFRFPKKMALPYITVSEISKIHLGWLWIQ